MTGSQAVCYGRRDMRSGVEMGRDAHARGNVRIPAREAGHVARRHRSEGLTLTHEMFSAKVESGTVLLRISEAGTAGLGVASSHQGLVSNRSI